MLTAAELTTDQAKTYAIVGVAALIVVGLLLSLLISKVVGKLIAIVIFVVAGVLLWNQRAQIEDKVRRCDTSFLGFKLKLTADQLKQCRQVTNQ